MLLFPYPHPLSLHPPQFAAAKSLIRNLQIINTILRYAEEPFWLQKDEMKFYSTLVLSTLGSKCDRL